MATCEICTRWPEGTFDFLHCVHVERGIGCKFCQFRCKREAFYMGGMNTCEEHMTAFNNRFQELLRHQAQKLQENKKEVKK